MKFPFVPFSNASSSFTLPNFTITLFSIFIYFLLFPPPIALILSLLVVSIDAATFSYQANAWIYLFIFWSTSCETVEILYDCKLLGLWHKYRNFVCFLSLAPSLFVFSFLSSSSSSNSSRSQVKRNSIFSNRKLEMKFPLFKKSHAIRISDHRDIESMFTISNIYIYRWYFYYLRWKGAKKACIEINSNNKVKSIIEKNLMIKKFFFIHIFFFALLKEKKKAEIHSQTVSSLPPQRATAPAMNQFMNFM